MSSSATTHTFDAAASPSPTLARPILVRALAATGTTLRTWRSRARDRIELAVMDERERRDLPSARQFDIRAEIKKPFWRE